MPFLLLASSCHSPPVKPQQGFEDPRDGVLEGEVKPASFEELYQTTRDVLERKGALTQENFINGKLEADIGASHAMVHLTQMELDRGFLRIRAYKQETREPDLDLAREIYRAVLDAKK
jgi:hypothetical protein